MPDRRQSDGPFSGRLIPDEDLHRLVEHQRQSEGECSHHIEFRVAVSASRRDGTRIVMQWCMRCRALEVLTWEAYQARRAAIEASGYEDGEGRDR